MHHHNYFQANAQYERQGHSGRSGVASRSTLPFAGEQGPIAVQIDWQNLLVSAARDDLPVDLPRLLACLGAAYKQVEVDLYTTPSMAPPPMHLPHGLALRVCRQSFSQNCDGAMNVGAMRQVGRWARGGYRVVIATGDAAFLSLHAELNGCLGERRCGFLTLPGRSTSVKILQHVEDLGVLGCDVLDDLRLRRAS